MKQQLSFIFFLLLVFPWSVNAADPAAIATLESVEGPVEVKRANSAQFAAASSGMTFYANDVIHTQAQSRAAIAFSDGGFLRLAANTSLEFQPRGAANQKSLSMSQGKAYYFGREPKSAPIIDTPSMTTAIRGTEFSLIVGAQQTEVLVLDGSVDCANAQGQVQIGANERASAEKGKAPVKSILLNPLDAVQWVITLPELLSEEDLGEVILKDPKIKTAWEFYKKRQRLELLQSLQDYKGKALLEVSLLRVSTYLAQGQISEAQLEIEKAQQLAQRENQPRISAALSAHQAVIELVRNQNSKALELVTQASQSAPDSPVLLYVQSFVSQALFDLPQARQQIEQYLKLAPQSAFGYARLSELESGFGELAQARLHAEQALALNPSDPYVLSVNGFSRLLRRDVAGALESFNAALDQQSNDGFVHLGKGLALIHSGDLELGRKEFERAAFLSPQVSLFRSYLGKAFFEQERSALADHEFERAIALDQRDPTPYLYRAFNQLTRNDPVAALSDVEHSIELNQNRAVYRSRLLLDQDLGVRSAGLAEVFNALGFSQAARLEAIKSINHDYLNYSGHFLLADSYQSILLGDAQKAEAKLANLLAPVSFNLFNRQSGNASQNEYNALFERPEQKTELSIEASTADDLFSSGARYASQSDDFGYSLAAKGKLNNGSKTGKFGRRANASLLTGYQATPDDRFTLGADVDYVRFNDLSSDPDNTLLNQSSFQAGFTHRFAPGSLVLAELSYTDDGNRYQGHGVLRPALFEEFFEDEQYVTDASLLLNESTRDRLHSTRGSIQHMFDSDYVSLVSGFQGNYAAVTRSEDSSLLDSDLEILQNRELNLVSRGANDLGSYDFYEYATVHAFDWLDLNAGLTFSSVELESNEFTPFIDQTYKRHQLNPKFGLTLYPRNDLTIRAAYFESLRKSSLENAISLEPTLVGGFNQRFTDYSGSSARNLGLGVDYKIAAATYAGAEVVRRHVVQPYIGGEYDLFIDQDDALNVAIAQAERIDTHQDQTLVKAYLGQVIGSRVSAVVNYEWSKFELPDPSIEQEVKLHKLEASLRYFDPSGLFPFFTMTWRNQDRMNSDYLENGVSAFWTSDLGIGYRLPERHGSIVLNFSNIFGEKFNYDQSFGVEQFVRPEFAASLVASVNF